MHRAAAAGFVGVKEERPVLAVVEMRNGDGTADGGARTVGDAGAPRTGERIARNHGRRLVVIEAAAVERGCVPDFEITVTWPQAAELGRVVGHVDAHLRHALDVVHQRRNLRPVAPVADGDAVHRCIGLVVAAA